MHLISWEYLVRQKSLERCWGHRVLWDTSFGWNINPEHAVPFASMHCVPSNADYSTRKTIITKNLLRQLLTQNLRLKWLLVSNSHRSLVLPGIGVFQTYKSEQKWIIPVALHRWDEKIIRIIQKVSLCFIHKVNSRCLSHSQSVWGFEVSELLMLKPGIAIVQAFSALRQSSTCIFAVGPW